MACERGGRFVLQELGADDLKKLRDLAELEKDKRPKFEELLDYFFTNDVEHSPQCPLCKTECKKALGSKCKDGCERWKINSWRDSAVAEWIVLHGDILVAKTTDSMQPTREGRVDQEARFLGCLTIPGVIQGDETAQSRWLHAYAKLCGKLGMRYMAARRARRRSLRMRPSQRDGVEETELKTPMKLDLTHPMRAGAAQGAATELENDEDDFFPWKVILDQNENVCWVNLS